MEGTAACILNAANEVSVEAFLNEKISFLDIADINEQTMLGVPMVHEPLYEDYVESDLKAREFASGLVSKLAR